MSKSRLFLFLLLAFIAGIAVRSFLYVPYLLLWFSTAISIVAIVLGTARKAPGLFITGFVAIALILGVIRYDFAENQRPDVSGHLGKTLSTVGVVSEDPQKTPLAQRLKVRIDGFYVLITTKKFPAYHYGDELRIEGSLKIPENLSDFDYKSFLAKDDIYAVMDFPQIKLIGSRKGDPLKSFLLSLKNSFEEKIDLALPEPHSSFLKGLLLGERESFSEELQENLSITGTTHIVALSGYNITLVSRFFMTGLLFLTIPYQISFWVAVSAVILFVMLTGASPSVVRAGIMGILILAAEREGRLYQIRNALVFAAAVMIFHNPKILRFDTSFELSFLAALGLIYLSPRVESLLEKIKTKLVGFRFEPSKGKVRQMLVETLSAQFAVLPLIIYLFGRVSLISPITNILVVAAVPYSMMIGFLVGLAAFFSVDLARILGGASWLLLEYKLVVIDLFAKIPLSSVDFHF